MISLTKDGKVLYRASNPRCIPFPATGTQEVLRGVSRNYEIFDPLDFLAEVTRIPNKGEHQIRCYGWYSNKKRGLQEKAKSGAPAPLPGMPETDTPYIRKCRLTWATLIKCVYEVDPLKCPKCGGTMKIVAFIEETKAIEKILRHCDLGKEAAPRPPPPQKSIPAPQDQENGPVLDGQYFLLNTF